jgi:peroxiredoxin
MVLLDSEPKLKIGERAPDFTLKGVDGRMHSLEEFKGAKAVLVIFMCNHCPYVKAKLEVIKGLAEKYADKGLIVIGINPNESDNYPEDSYENMVRVAREKEFNFHYLHDETQEVAKAYGAVCTPDPFLFDWDFKLVYHGRLDNALSPGQVASQHDMEEAIEGVLSGEKVEKEFLPSMGCSIKWKY